MPRVLVFLNEIVRTSIPFELSLHIAETTDANIVVASLYDKSSEDFELINGKSELPIDIKALGATSRFDRCAWSEFHAELDEEYDLIHTHNNFSGSVARCLAVSKNIPIINTEHRDHSSYSLLQNLINAPTLPLADWNISNSNTTQNSFRWYERLLLDKNQLSVIHNGVDVEQVDTVSNKQAKLREDDTFRICTVGRMVPVKNQTVLIRAFSSITKEYQNVELLFVGDGALRSDLERLSMELGLSNNIRFVGEIPRQRVYKVLGKSNVFVMPSSAEGFCVAAVEAMAAGLPVVVSDIPVFHEVVGEPGLFADPNDPTAFAYAISDLLRDPERRRTLGQANRDRARNRFSLERTALEYYNIYKQVAETGGQ